MLWMGEKEAFLTPSWAPCLASTGLCHEQLQLTDLPSLSQLSASLRNRTRPFLLVIELTLTDSQLSR